ncbi:MAG: hypothetical protein KF911_15870 [Pseudomonadales bacterium]|nr:hypothetical protein [Pseudomonadales bacterium]
MNRSPHATASAPAPRPTAHPLARAFRRMRRVGWLLTLGAAWLATPGIILAAAPARADPAPADPAPAGGLVNPTADESADAPAPAGSDDTTGRSAPARPGADVFVPSEEISEDFTVSFPVDI